MNDSGVNNAYLGGGAGRYLTSGSENVFLGYNSGTVEGINVNTSVAIGRNTKVTGDQQLAIDNSSTSTPLIYGEFDNDLLVINGNVGIGTTTPGNYKLKVEGDLWASNLKTPKVESAEIEVQLEHQTPDYVFEGDYNLRSIEDVEQFIKSNKHLPEIPSAAEVEANGNRVNVGEMQMKLLQKVEELTLYMIELKKENNAYKNELDHVKTELAKIKRDSGFKVVSAIVSLRSSYGLSKIY